MKKKDNCHLNQETQCLNYEDNKHNTGACGTVHNHYNLLIINLIKQKIYQFKEIINSIDKFNNYAYVFKQETE